MRSKKYKYEYQVNNTPEFHAEMPLGDDKVNEGAGTFDIETATYTGWIGESQAILARIEEAIIERDDKDDGVYPRVVILGEHEYVAADSYIRWDGGDGLESNLSVDVYVVPGRMIHVPRKNEFVPGEYLSDD